MTNYELVRRVNTNTGKPEIYLRDNGVLRKLRANGTGLETFFGDVRLVGDPTTGEMYNIFRYERKIGKIK